MTLEERAAAALIAYDAATIGADAARDAALAAKIAARIYRRPRGKTMTREEAHAAYADAIRASAAAEKEVVAAQVHERTALEAEAAARDRLFEVISAENAISHALLNETAQLEDIAAAAEAAAAQAAQAAEYAVASVLALAADSALGTAQRAFCATWDLSDGDAEEYEWDYEIAGRAHEAAYATVLQIVRDADEAYAASYVLDEDRRIGLISEHFWFMGAAAEEFFE